MSPRSRLAVAGVLFFGSGFAALIYQVAWQRILVFHTGIGAVSVSLIVAAFMAGLGVGSYVGGILSPRVKPAQAFRIFGLAEVLLGLFALASCGLYYDGLYVAAYWLFAEGWRAALTQFLCLMPPTFLMGLSLPFLVRALVREPGPAASRVVGYLYAVNVLGASVGALLTPWVLIRFHGIRGAVAFGAVANLIAGIVAFVFGRALVDYSSTPHSVIDPPSYPPPGRGEGPQFHDLPRDGSPAVPRLWIVLYGLSGFVALSLEIVWFRVVDVATKSTALSFGTVLGVYLFGVGLGTLAGVQEAPRLRRPLHRFLLLQCLLVVYAAAAMLFLARAPALGDLPRWLHAYWGQYDEFVPGLDRNLGMLVRLYACLPFALFGIPTTLMGLSFVALQRAVQNDPSTSGRKVGVLQAANIAGCALGSLGVGLVLLNRLGTLGTLRLIIVCAVAFAAVGVRRFGVRSSFGLLGVALAVLAFSVPASEALWLRLHGRTGGPAVLGEDGTGVVVIAPEGRGPRWQVSVNGRGVSSLPFGGLHSELGAVPALMHPSPDQVAIVGLGSGDTAWAASCRDETRRTTVFEIVGPQLPLLQEVGSLTGWPDMRAFLADPRLIVQIADARRALEREGSRYDVIEGDPLEPHSAFSGNLYSVEFFRICASRLRREGLMCSYAPSARTRATFLAVFPHVLEFRGGQFLLGSNDAVEIDLPRWRDRLQAVSGYLGASIAAQVAASLESVRTVQRVEPAESAINRDLFPRDEFLTP